MYKMLLRAFNSHNSPAKEQWLFPPSSTGGMEDSVAEMAHSVTEVNLCLVFIPQGK